MARLLRLEKQPDDPFAVQGSGPGRPPHQGHDPAPAGRGDRGHQPPRPRPRRGRRAHRGGRRRGRELRAVDLRPLPERRPDPGRRARASRCSTTSAPTLMDRVHEGDVAPHRARASSGATASCSAAARCSTAPRSKRRWRTARADHRRGARALRREHARVHPARRRGSRSSRSTLPAAPHRRSQGRHALVVVRGHDYRSDLAALRSYIREYRPVLIGVDGGADALLEHRPQARHHHRRLRLGVGEGPAAAAPSWCTTCIPTGAPRGARTCSSGASTTTSSWPRAPAKTSPCCSRTSRRRS